MCPFRFPDLYREAGFDPSPEVVSRRLEAFEKISPHVEFWRTVDLVRMFYGLPARADLEWFRDAFASNDPTFSLVSNERECAVLAACLLGADLSAAFLPAALTTLCASAFGHRTPVVLPDLLVQAREALHGIALTDRERGDLASISGQRKEVESRLSSSPPDLAKIALAVKDSLLSILNRVEVLEDRSQFLQEDSDILWWFIGTWSRSLSVPYSRLPNELAAYSIGFDMASLCRGRVGPAATEAILFRLLSAASKDPEGRVRLDALGDAAEGDQLRRLSAGPRVERLADLCPVSYCLHKVLDVGPSPAWCEAYFRETGLPRQAEFRAVDLAMQVYWEDLLLNQVPAST